MCYRIKLMANRNKLIYLRSLGCNKNTVDSEIILSLLKGRGYKRTDNPDKASKIIINTCAFIDDAKEEAIDTIFELSQYKKKGSQLIVTGCFSQLYHREIIAKLPEVDAVIGVGNLGAVLDAVESSDSRKDFSGSRDIGDVYKEYLIRDELITPPGYSYLKIAEGCSNKCSFCLIPKIKGKLRSRTLSQIIEEAVSLEKTGVKEIILISQDTLSYGCDLNMRGGLKVLIKGLLENTGIKFFRLLYLRPDPELLENIEIFENSRLLPYFDIPIQHVSKKILKSMNRIGDPQLFSGIIKNLRDGVQNAVLRTSLIAGFPGETEDDFNTLLDFIEEVRFNHIGVFSFSPQRETEAFKLKGRVDKNIIEKRKNKLLELQKKISRENLEEYIGKVYDVIIEEGFEPGDRYIGRSYHFAPEVDGVFLVRSKRRLKAGDLIKAKVTRADDYDLHGYAINSCY